MIAALYVAGVAVALIYALWVYYLAVMCLKRVNDVLPLSGATRVAALTVLWPGYALDFLTNMTVMTVLLLELPHEALVTARLKRHASNETWRGFVCSWICLTLLDRFDPSGCHCK